MWTSPAITAAAARVRDSNSPRSASKESRRTRGTGRNGTRAGPAGDRCVLRCVPSSPLSVSRCSRSRERLRQTPLRARLRGSGRLDLPRRPADLRRADRRARAAAWSCACRAATMVDEDGLLTGPEGTLAGRARDAGARRPAGLDASRTTSVLRQRPGHYYWQAYLTGERRRRRGADRARPGAHGDAAGRRPRPRQAVPKYGRKGTAELLPLDRGLPGVGRRTRFKKLAKTTASRWGLKARRWTSAKAGVQDGSASPASRRRCRAGCSACRPTTSSAARVESDLALRAERELGRGPGLPGAVRGRPRERPPARARPHGRQQEAPVALHELAHDRGARRRRVVARGARQVVRRLLSRASAASVRKTFVHRIVRID